MKAMDWVSLSWGRHSVWLRNREKGRQVKARWNEKNNICLNLIRVYMNTLIKHRIIFALHFGDGGGAWFWWDPNKYNKQSKCFVCVNVDFDYTCHDYFRCCMLNALHSHQLSANNAIVSTVGALLMIVVSKHKTIQPLACVYESSAIGGNSW